MEEFTASDFHAERSLAISFVHKKPTLLPKQPEEVEAAIKEIKSDSAWFQPTERQFERVDHFPIQPYKAGMESRIGRFQ